MSPIYNCDKCARPLHQSEVHTGFVSYDYCAPCGDAEVAVRDAYLRSMSPVDEPTIIMTSQQVRDLMGDGS